LPSEVGEAKTSALALLLIVAVAAVAAAPGACVALLECNFVTDVVDGSKPCRKADQAT